MVKVLPEPVTPSSTWSRSSARTPETSSAMAVGWSPFGSYSDTTLSRRVSGFAGCFSGMKRTREEGRTRVWDMTYRWWISDGTSRGREGRSRKGFTRRPPRKGKPRRTTEDRTKWALRAQRPILLSSVVLRGFPFLGGLRVKPSFQINEPPPAPPPGAPARDTRCSCRPRPPRSRRRSCSTTAGRRRSGTRRARPTA